MNQNAFLRDFIKMRQEVNARVPAPPQPGQGKPAKPQKEDKTASDSHSIRSICEEKPPKSDVLEYFRQRIEAIVAEADD